MLVQTLDPLAVASVGLGPALDLTGEVGRRDDHLEAGLQQGEEQDVAVDAGGFEGDGGDAALSQPGDELTQPGRVGGELAHGVGWRRGWTRRRPSGFGRRRRCRRHGAATRARRRRGRRPRPADGSRSAKRAARRRAAAAGSGRSAGGGGCGVRVGRAFPLRTVMAVSRMGGRGRAAGESAQAQPSQRDRPRRDEDPGGGRRQTSGPKTLPVPVEPPGRA